jgi:hypothetical protein
MTQTKSDIVYKLYDISFKLAYAPSPEEAELYTYELRDVLSEFKNSPTMVMVEGIRYPRSKVTP